jgi:hypothetical protein
MRIQKLPAGSVTFRVTIFLLLSLTGTCAVAQESPGTSLSAGQSTPSLPGLVQENADIPKRSDLIYEDWRMPELPPGMRSEIHELGRHESKKFVRELLHAQWREMDQIDLFIVRPANVKKAPVILYLYSFPSNTDRYKDDVFCEFLTRNGFAAVGFAPALTGQRFHDRPTADWFVSQLAESIGTTTHDVQMTLNYLETRKEDFDMDRVGLWGDGAGAAIAILAASVDSRIKAVDALDPWGDWPNWFAKSTLVPDEERERYLKPEYLKTLDALDPVAVLPNLKSHVRIQHIGDVTVTPTVVREHLAKALPKTATIVTYKDKLEFFKTMGSMGKTFLWLQGELNPIMLNAGAGTAGENRRTTD